MRNATSNSKAFRNLRSSRKVTARRPNAARIEPCARSAPLSTFAIGSGTRRNSGMAKTDHHTAVKTKLRRAGSEAARAEIPSPAGNPTAAGYSTKSNASNSNNPPPTYPSAYPAVDTRSISSLPATWGNSAS